ncbi:MAG: hypothetical protein EOP04_03140 [Proteobacteria bacterium]|nr:MAG: hypothetical protein EOP04_03140 [Pseudomonadota bacterium]
MTKDQIQREWTTDITELEELISNLPYAHVAGGTFSSENLMRWLDVREQLNARFYAKIKNLQRYKSIAESAIKVWRNALERHNSQLLKFTSYNVAIGTIDDSNFEVTRRNGSRPTSKAYKTQEKSHERC